MISIILSATLISSIWVFINSNNPIKTSFFILISTAIIFFFINTSTGIVWIPLIFFILFTGGILIIFMILSSVLPNENTLNINYSNILTLITLTTLLLATNINQVELSSSQIKSFFTTGINIIFITTIILIYFFNSINLNSTEDSPMRSLQCYQNNNFVNY